MHRLFESGKGILWGTAQDAASFGVTLPFDGGSAGVGNGTMLGLRARDPAQVDRLHALALALGGADEGAPGQRDSGFYAGYFRDLDGHKLNAHALV